MTVAPLQLPVWKDVPRLDFTPLNQIGDAALNYRQNSAIANGLMPQSPDQQGNGLNTLGQPPVPPANIPNAPAAPATSGLTQDQMALLGQSAHKYGLDPNYLINVASKEGTGQNPNSSADGIGQFTAATAKQYGVNPNDPASAADGFARFTLDNAKALSQTLGRAPTPAELALAHQQGAGGATALLSNPNANAIDALTAAYKGNRALATQAVVNNGGDPNMTAGQFAQKQMAYYSGGQNAQLPPNAQPAQYAGQPQQGQPQAQPQPGQPGPGAYNPLQAIAALPADQQQRLRAMIMAGGNAQKYALAMLQQYAPKIVTGANGGFYTYSPVGGLHPTGMSDSKPVPVPFGSPGVVTSGPNGQPALTSFGGDTLGGNGGGQIPPGIKFAVDRSVAGDPHAFEGMPRSGPAGYMAFNQVNGELARRAAAGEITPAQLVTARANAEALFSGAKAMGTQEAKVGSAAVEAGNAIGLARDAINNVARISGGFGPLNRPFNEIKQLYDEHALNPAQTELYTRAQAVINTYATVMSRNGVPTDAAREHATQLLDTAGSPATWGRALDTMQSEINMAKTSPGTMRQQFNTEFQNGVNQPAGAQPGPQGQRAPQGNAPIRQGAAAPVAMPKITDRNTANLAIAAARKAIASGKDPVSVNNALKQMGIPPLAGN